VVARQRAGQSLRGAAVGKQKRAPAVLCTRGSYILHKEPRAPLFVRRPALAKGHVRREGAIRCVWRRSWC
jgi:hypothetical protein